MHFVADNSGCRSGLDGALIMSRHVNAMSKEGNDNECRPNESYSEASVQRSVQVGEQSEQDE